MSGLLGDQAEVTSRSPLKVRNLDDASVVNDVSAETVTFQYNNSGALASGTGQASGTMIFAKLEFDGVLSSFKDKPGDMKDSSFEFVTGTVLTTAFALDVEGFVDSWRRFTVAEKFTEMAKYLKTDGDYWIDHADGGVWGIAAATVADDTANYSYKSPTGAGGSGTLASEVQGNAAHDAVDVGSPVKIGGKASTTEPTAVANGDRVDAYFDENGYLHIVNIVNDTATNSDKVFEVAQERYGYSDGDLADTTNVTAATHYYPSSTGGVMDSWKDQSLTGKFIDADGTLTLTLEVTNDEDSAGDWNGAYFYDDELNSTVATKTVTNGTELFTLSANNNNFRRYRWVVVASGATNTVILKERKKAL